MALSIAFSLKRDRVLAYTLKRRNENKMDKLKEKLSRLMYGRYGIDQLGNFMMWAAVAMMIFGAVVRSSLIYTLALVLVVWADVRIMSKNHSKRYAENQKFLELKNRVVGFFRGGTRAFKDKEHCYFRCPSCHQQVRVPKGKGHIEIRCPKCGTKFIKTPDKRSSAIHVWLCDHPKG